MFRFLETQSTMARPIRSWSGTAQRKTWWMLYTNRRADLDGGNGVTWVHGTHIGIAESADGGAHWKYVSEADIPLPHRTTRFGRPR